MFDLRRVSIATRLTGGFLIMALIVLLLGMMSMRQASTIQHEVVDINEQWVPRLHDLSGINQDFLLYRTFALRLLLSTEVEDINRRHGRMKALATELEAKENSLQRRINLPEPQHIFDEFRDLRRRYMAISENMVQAYIAGDDDTAMRMADEHLFPMANKATEHLQALERLVFAGSAAAAQRAEAAYVSARAVVVVSIVIAIALTLLLAWMLTRSIVGPLRQAMSAGEVIATGDLTQRIEIAGRDEATRLLEALASMQGQLRDTIYSIANSSSQLASAAEELNAVTEDATRSLQQQNNEIQQAATAVNEMSVAVEEVASNAVQTSEESRTTATSAEQGREQTLQALVSMEKLSETIRLTTTEVQALAAQTQNINSVLDVIRAVAEQTNLLALNAAIEAARAGEHGRGFAVVADEVRALAHRTQQSTGEIEEMINAIQQVTERTVAAMEISDTMAANTQRQSQKAGEAFGLVSTAVNQINERNLVIASAAEEQAQVAQEVDRNLVNIRDLSTQSAAGAEQTSAASRELSRLAVELNQLITRFRT